MIPTEEQKANFYLAFVLDEKTCAALDAFRPRTFNRPEQRHVTIVYDWDKVDMAQLAKMTEGDERRAFLQATRFAENGAAQWFEVQDAHGSPIRPDGQFLHITHSLKMSQPSDLVRRYLSGELPTPNQFRAGAVSPPIALTGTFVRLPKRSDPGDAFKYKSLLPSIAPDVPLYQRSPEFQYLMEHFRQATQRFTRDQLELCMSTMMQERIRDEVAAFLRQPNPTTVAQDGPVTLTILAKRVPDFGPPRPFGLPEEDSLKDPNHARHVN